MSLTAYIEQQALIPTPGPCRSDRFNKLVANLQEMCNLDVLNRLCVPAVEPAFYLPWSVDNVSFMGAVPGHPGVHVLAGHSCWGILNGPATGLCTAHLIL